VVPGKKGDVYIANKLTTWNVMNIFLKIFGKSNKEEQSQTDTKSSSQSDNCVTISYSAPKKDKYEY
jgi:hypothetical protein